MLGVARHQVTLMSYQKVWAKDFIQAKKTITKIWPKDILAIQHVGSTAIPTIDAKPILDIAIVIQSFKQMDIQAMAQAGYDYRGAQNEEKSHFLFVLRGANGQSLQHIHCYEPNNQDYQNLISFRDYLITHPATAKAYNHLKRRLAKQYAADRKAYTLAKADFIKQVYTEIDGINNKKAKNKQ